MGNGKIKAAIVGASGYSGEELIRLISKHPDYQITVITSRKNAMAPVGDVFPRFASSGLFFSDPDIKQIVSSSDVAFLALPHGLAAEFAIPLLEAGLKVLDISADFRLKSVAKYIEYYKAEHPAPALLEKAVYGLPERYRGKIRSASLIACAGCYPTSCILATAPLLAAGLASPTGIVISSASGVTGAGRKVELPYIFPECNESFRAYSPVGHRHTPEIEQELAAAAGLPEITLNFIPHLAPMNRGINTTVILDRTAKTSVESVAAAYEAAYKDEPFVRVLPHGKCSDTKNVTMSNICEIGFTVDPRTSKVIVTSAIDNLTKGASGQALQCANIMFGLDETSGLR